MDELDRLLAVGPRIFPHSLDAARDMLLLLEVDEVMLHEASFLDERLLKPGIWGRWIPIDDILARLDPQARDDAHYIFHIGHVGSTLVSRLLGECETALCLREPLLIRHLADLHAQSDQVNAPWDPALLPRRLPAFRSLLARTFRSDQRVIVKATSFTSEIAPELVSSKSRAIFLYASPQTYLTTILAGDNSRAELTENTRRRLLRLARRMEPMPYRLWTLDEGEQIALGWMTEMLALEAAADALPPGSVLWIDFDGFLRQPVETMLTICRHFDLPSVETEIARIVAGPIMHRYSKSPDHPYGPELRRTLLSQAAHTHSAALRSGLAWLDKLRATWPRAASTRGLSAT
jgi:hypothetical protein